MCQTQARVIFLDETSHSFVLDKKCRGAALIERVFNHLELTEREYFGLIFNDAGGTLPPGHTPGIIRIFILKSKGMTEIFLTDMMRWLDPQKPVRKQMRASLHPSSSSSSSSNTMLNTSSSKHPPPTLYFRVKFYVNGEKIQNSNRHLFSLVLGKQIYN